VRKEDKRNIRKVKQHVVNFIYRIIANNPATTAPLVIDRLRPDAAPVEMGGLGTIGVPVPDGNAPSCVDPPVLVGCGTVVLEAGGLVVGASPSVTKLAQPIRVLLARWTTMERLPK